MSFYLAICSPNNDLYFIHVTCCFFLAVGVAKSLIIPRHMTFNYTFKKVERKRFPQRCPRVRVGLIIPLTSPIQSCSFQVVSGYNASPRALFQIHTDMQSELHSSKISRNIRKHTTIVLPPNNLTHPEAQINHGVFSAVDRPKNMKKHYSTISKASVLLNLRSRHVSRIS